ncbi:MAG TPA: hypothetical protein VHY80_11765 [Stellaceae bacterium]|nr:hypothetical protein [Stellaceae bacterium]
MDTVLLMVHGILAVFLLGALTHQAFAVWWRPARGDQSFFAGYRAVRAERYVNTTIVLYLLTYLVGGFLLYPEYRYIVRPVLEQLRRNATLGSFELKEHFMTVGVALLPLYWYLWKQPNTSVAAQKLVTLILALLVWYGFVVGHLLNNTRGFGL